MKKFAELAGTIGSTAAWYILSNKQLRTELGQAKTPDDTVKILSGYLGRDASTIAQAVHAYTHSDEFTGSLQTAKEFAGEKLSDAKKGLSGLWAKAKQAKDAALQAAKNDDGPSV